MIMLIVTICAVVTVAATGDKHGEFDTVVAENVVAKNIYATNDAGDAVVALVANDYGGGMITTYSAQGNMQVMLNATIRAIFFFLP